MLKTIRRDEFVFLRKILKDYHEHLKKNRMSLIPKFFSLNKIKFNNTRLIKELGFDQVYFVVMNNIFSQDLVVHERYDLKGSTYKRETFPAAFHTSDNPFLTNEKEIRLAMKDLDFNRRKGTLKVTGAQKEMLKDTINKDCEFFKRLGIIDYSMLVGVHYKDREPRQSGRQYTDEEFVFGDEIYDMGGSSEELPTCFTFDSPNNNEKYLIGIIDILTSFGTIKKKCEYAIKRLCVGNSISCLPPGQYSDRFVTFMDKIFDGGRSLISKTFLSPKTPLPLNRLNKPQL